MEDNAASTSAGPGGNELWFLSADCEEHVFRAEGRVSRIPGEPNRVQFTGSCVLDDSPDQKLQVQGSATVTVAKDLRGRAKHSYKEGSTAATEVYKTSSEMDRHDFLKKMRETIASASAEFERIKSISTTGQDGGLYKSAESGSTLEGFRGQEQFDQISEHDSDTELESVTPSSWSSELEDSVFLHSPTSDVERLQEAIALGHVVTGRGGAERAGAGHSVGQRMQAAVAQGRVVTKRGGVVRSVGLSKSTETLEEDSPFLVSPIRRLRFSPAEDEQDDPYFFSPLPWIDAGRGTGEEMDDNPAYVSPIRHLNALFCEEEQDEEFIFTPIPRRRRQVIRSPVTAQEASPVSEDLEELRTASEASMMAQDLEDMLTAWGASLTSEDLEDLRTASEASIPESIGQLPGPSRLRFEIEERRDESSVSSARVSSSEISDDWLALLSDEEGSMMEEEFGHLTMRHEIARSHLEDATYDAFKVTGAAAIFAATVVECLTKRVLTNAWINAHEAEEGRDIFPDDVARGINDDVALRQLLKDVVLPMDPLPMEE